MSNKNDDLNERVNQAIRAQLLALMPEEELRKKVDAEMENFFAPKKNDYSGKFMASPFAEIVGEELKKRVRPALEEMFRSDKWKLTTDDDKGTLILGEALKKIIEFDPSIIPTWAARQAQLNMAKGIVTLLAEFHTRSGNWDYASAFQRFMDDELKNLEGIPL